jgi:hypothetical protein
MKKYLMILVAMICFGVGTTYADGTKTCKVSGTTGSVEVSVYEENTKEGTASISFSNDTDVDVNIRYVVRFYSDVNMKEFVGERSGSFRVPQHDRKSIPVNINKSYSKVTVSSISGEKCTN